MLRKAGDGFRGGRGTKDWPHLCSFEVMKQRPKSFNGLSNVTWFVSDLPIAFVVFLWFKSVPNTTSSMRWSLTTLAEEVSASHLPITLSHLPVTLSHHHILFSSGHLSVSKVTFWLMILLPTPLKVWRQRLRLLFTAISRITLDT